MSSSTSTRTDRRPIQPADLYQLRAVSDVTLHPNLEVIVYAVARPDAATDSNRCQLYAVDLDGGNPRQLTHGHRDTGAVFSPDGGRLAFIRTEPDRPARLMVLSWPLGEISEAAEFADGAGPVHWLSSPAASSAQSTAQSPAQSTAQSTAQGDRLVVSAPQRPGDQEGISDDDLARRPRILTTINYRYNGRGYTHDRPRQLFVVSDPWSETTADGAEPEPEAEDEDEAAGAIRPIGAIGVDHGAFAVSPDGTRVAATAVTDPDADLTGGNHIWVYTVDGSTDPVRLTSPGGSWESLIWHRDGRLVATGMTDASVTGFHHPHLVGLPEQGPVPSIDRVGDHDNHVVPGGLSGNGMVAIHQHLDGGATDRGTGPATEPAVLYPGVRRGRIGVDRYSLDDGRLTVVHDDHHQVVAFDASPDGRILVAAVTSTERPAELWRLDGEPRRLVSLNDRLLAQLDLATTEVISVTSQDGTEVEAFVVRPPGSAPRPDSLHPGLVYVHGGPMFQYGRGFFDEFQMAAACGYVVVAGNPRGSDGYGEAWAQAIVGDLGNKDWADVTALADRLQSLPEVDGDRIGIGGGSYGGFMASWALGHDQRFKAGLVERAVTSWNTMFGTSDIGNWFSAKTIGATIESNPAGVTQQSPLHHAAGITAPTLIVHSEEDWRCPIEQAEQLFAAIRRNGGRATLVRFPGENHELTRSGKPSHRVIRFEIVHEFFARHLGGADFGTDHLGTDRPAGHGLSAGP